MFSRISVKEFGKIKLLSVSKNIYQSVATVETWGLAVSVPVLI